VSLRHGSIFVLLCVMWGVPYFFIKLALEDLSPVCIAWLRITLAALVLAPIAWRRGVLQPALRHRGAIVAFAFAELIIPFPLISLAETWISSSLTGLLIASAPLMTAALAPLFGIKEALTVRRTLGLLAGFIGVLTLLGFDDSGGTYQWAGVACVVVATVGYVVGPLVVQKHLRGIDDLGSLAASLIIASVVLMPAALFAMPARMPSTTALGSILVLGLVCTAAALLLYFYLISQAGAARASIIAYVCPAVAALLGVVVLGERFTSGMVIAFGLIITGSWMATHLPPPARTPALGVARPAEQRPG
jgi:drug/metabolite transporter (DMT)-like permease